MDVNETFYPYSSFFLGWLIFGHIITTLTNSLLIKTHYLLSNCLSIITSLIYHSILFHMQLRLIRGQALETIDRLLTTYTEGNVCVCSSTVNINFLQYL